MGRQLQKRKLTQPSLNTPRPRASQRTPSQKAKSDIQSNVLLGKHWDHSITAAENYKRMGVVKRLRGRIDPHGARFDGAGLSRGVKRTVDGEEKNEGVADEMKVVRDPISGAILKVVNGSETTKKVEKRSTAAQEAWKGRTMPDLLDESDEEEAQSIIRIGGGQTLADEIEVEARIRSRAPSAAKVKRLSPRDKELCARLVDKYGVSGEGYMECDLHKMCRDKMNVMQLSHGQIRARMSKYLGGQGKKLVEVD